MTDVALFMADAHLDEEPWTGRPIYGDSFCAFDYMVKYAIEHNVRYLIGAGDLIDVRRPPSVVVAFLRQALRRLQKKNILFAYVQGQHELSNPPWVQAVDPQAIHLHGKALRIGEQTIYGLDWTPADLLPAAMAAIPYTTDILVCHQVWEEFMGDITAPEGSLLNVPHAKTIITGDYHKNVSMKIGEGTTVYSPGATHMRKIDEPANHYFYVLNDAGELRREKIPGRIVFRAELTKEASIGKLITAWEQHAKKVSHLPKPLQTPLMHVKYPASRPEIKRQVRAYFADKTHLFWKKVPTKKSAIETELTAERVQQLGPAGCLRLLVPETDKRYKPLLRLLTSPDRRAELLAMRKERLGDHATT